MGVFLCWGGFGDNSMAPASSDIHLSQVGGDHIGCGLLLQNPSFPCCNLWNGKSGILLSPLNRYGKNLRFHLFLGPFFPGLYFILVVQKIGVTQVRKVVEEYNLKFCKVPVISNRRDAKYGKSHCDLEGGWLLITHCNNPSKKAFIEKISEILHLGIKVLLKD